MSATCLQYAWSFNLEMIETVRHRWRLSDGQSLLRLLTIVLRLMTTLETRTIDLYAVALQRSRREQVVDVVTYKWSCRDGNANLDVPDTVIEEGRLSKNSDIAVIAGANSVDFAVLDHRARCSVPIQITAKLADVILQFSIVTFGA